MIFKLMEKKMKMLTLILMTIFTTTTYAQNNSSRSAINEIQKAYDSCLETAYSTLDMHACALETTKKAQAELSVVTNRIYTSLENSLKTGDYSSEDVQKIKVRISKSKKTWDAYTLAKCELQGVEMLGGTGEGMIIFGCYAASTIEYVKELQNIFGLLF